MFLGAVLKIAAAGMDYFIMVAKAFHHLVSSVNKL